MILTNLIMVCATEVLGLGRQGWVVTFVLPATGKRYYRRFHYKADAERLRQEVVKNFPSRQAILDYYGTRYWTELEERV